MPNTMTLISTVTASGNALFLEFTGIPQTFTDLILTGSVRTTFSGVSDTYFLRLNNDGSTTNTSRRLIGNGSSASSTNNSSTSQALIGDVSGATATSNTFGSFTVYIPNYTGNTQKSYSADSVGESNHTNTLQTITAGVYQSTGAINRILVSSANGSEMVLGSTFSLYGITKGSGGATVA